MGTKAYTHACAKTEHTQTGKENQRPAIRYQNVHALTQAQFQ